MGRPFEKELSKIFGIYNWSLNLPTDKLISFIENSINYPLITIGSGGSISACKFVNILHQKFGVISTTMTPLELFYNDNILRNSNFIIISAGGRNPDIISAFKKIISHEPRSILNIVMRKNSPLAKLSFQYSISQTIEFDIPSKKDGFLATNSLLAYFGYFGNSYSKIFNNKINNNIEIEKDYFDLLDFFIKNIQQKNTLSLLYGGWGMPVAYDIESKITESALGNIQISDYRNFGHGRHHWFAKKGSETALIALISNKEKELSKKTLSLIPNDIPKLSIISHQDEINACIELLVKSFFFINSIGKMKGIDPGRPGVPEFGKKLYRLNFYSGYKERLPRGISENKALSILRKTNFNDIKDLNENELNFWSKAYDDFIFKLNNANFGSILFDYDGTLCSSEDRFKGLSNGIKEKIISFLENEIYVGIVTGRGESVRDVFRKCIPKCFWDKIIIGYYNGSDIGELSDDAHPDTNKNINENLLKISEYINNQTEMFDFEHKIGPNQISFRFDNEFNLLRNKDRLYEVIRSSRINGIKIIESSHSVDIIPDFVSKQSVYLNLRKLITAEENKNEVLCIGDKGMYPGNDFQLLSSEYSLSVDEVSSDSQTCWNVAKKGVKLTDATLEYLNNIIFSHKYFNCIFK